MNKRCPRCNTSFNVGPEDEGKEFTCFNCTAALVMTHDGLRLAAGGGAPPTVSPGRGPVAAPMYAEPLPAAGGPRRAFWRTIDWPTCLFGLGAWLVIVFLFFPLLSQAKTRQAQAMVTIGQLHEDRLASDFEKQKDTATTADKDTRKKEKDAWEKEKGRLQDEADSAKARADLEDYWYLWGMMFGFLVLAVAALWYLTPSQPLIRRIVGSIVIVAEVVLIFLRFVVEGR